MQLANVWLALGEDKANTVPKKGVTPAEVALLTAIHGENAVDDIAILDDTTDIAPRALLQDLAAKYGNARNSENQPIIKTLYPTASAPVPDTFAELGLMDAQFTAASIEKMAKRKSARRKPAKADTAGNDDGVKDMPPSGAAMG